MIAYRKKYCDALTLAGHQLPSKLLSHSPSSLLSTSHQQTISSHSLWGTSVHTAVALEVKCLDDGRLIPLQSFFLPGFISSCMSMMPCDMEYPYQLGSAVLDMFPLSLWLTPILLASAEPVGWGWRDNPDAVPALLSNSQNAGVLSTPF